MKKYTLLLLPILALAAVSPLWAEPISIEVGGQRVIEPDKKDIPQGMKGYWHVFGLGQNEKEATQDAISKARFVVAAFLARQKESFAWKPDVDYVKKNLVRGKAKFEGDAAFDVKKLKDVVRKWYSVPIGIAEDDLKKMVREDRRHRARQFRVEQRVRSESRLVLITKVVALIVGGCLLGVFYLRLEEKTKGYLSRWLGVALVSALVSAAIALLIFF